MPTPTHAVLSSALSSHVPLAAVPGGDLVGTKGVLNSLMGWEDVEANIHEYDLLDQEVVHSITTAEQQFRHDPTPRNRVRFKAALQQAQQASEQLQQYCLRQQAHYQALLDQELAAQNQPQSYFASWQSWVVNGVRYFFGSDNAALVEKYRQAAEKEQRWLDVLTNQFAQLDAVQEEVQTLDQAVELPQASRQLMLERRSLANGNITIINPIPDMLLEPGVPFHYCLDGNRIFSGNRTALLTIANNPSWLTLAGASYSMSSGPFLTPGIFLQSNTIFLVGALAKSSGYQAASLEIVDVTNPVNPILLSEYALYGSSGHGIVVQDNIAFIGTDSGLEIINVTNLTHPVSVSHYANYTTYGSIVIQGNIAFMATGYSGLQIVNVSNLTNPVLLGSYPTSLGSAIFIQDDIAFVGNVLTLLNISNLASPRLLSTCNTVVAYNKIAVQGSMAFVVDGAAALYIVNVGNPAHPVLLGHYTTLNPVDLFIQGNTVFVAASAGLQILNVSNPADPTLLGSIPPPELAHAVVGSRPISSGVIVQENMVFVALDVNSFAPHPNLQIINLAQLCLEGTPLSTDVGMSTLTISTISSYNTLTVLASDSFTLAVSHPPQFVSTTLLTQSVFPNHNLSSVLSTDVLFTNVDQQFLRLSVSIGDKNTSFMPSWFTLVSQPEPIAQYNNPQGVATVFISGNLAFLTNTFGPALQILNVGDPANPVLLGGCSTGASGFEVFVQNNIAFVAAWSAGLQIINITNSANPLLLGNYTMPYQYAQCIFVQGNIAFVGWGGGFAAGLQIVDVTDFSNPVLLTNYSPVSFLLGVGVVSVFVQDNTAFIATNGLGLAVLNVANLANPLLLGSYNASGINALVVQGTIAFVTVEGIGNDGSLLLIDVSNPANLVLLSNYTLPGVMDVSLQGSTAFLTTPFSGLHIVDVRDTARPMEIGSYILPSSLYGISVQVKGSAAFVAANIMGLQILSLTNWQLTFSPNSSHVGNYQVRVTVTNPLGASGFNTFLLRVEGPPQFTAQIPHQYAKVGQAFSYFIPQGMVLDPNFDTPTFIAVVKGQNTLLPWLGFNGISAFFAGTPQSQDKGNFTIALSVTDNVPGTAIMTQDFSLYVDYAPVLNQPMLRRRAAFGRLFNFTLSTLTFVDPDGDALTYYAHERNQPNLPAWLTFNPQTQTFLGRPNTTDAGLLALIVGATDPYDGRAEGDFEIQVGENAPPMLNIPIFSKVADVGLPFDFVAGPDTFIDPEDNVLTYSATQLDGTALPAWLKFDALKVVFSGKPGRGDTGVYADRVIEVALTANDGLQQSSTVFNINVRGTSSAELAIKIVAPIVSAFTTAYTTYKKRALLLNRCHRNQYQRIADHPKPGDYFEQPLQTALADIRGFATQVPRPVSSCCRFFRLPYRHMPGVAELPRWLVHDTHTNRLVSTMPIPDNLAGRTLIIQVLGKDDVVLEAFQLVMDNAEMQPSAHTGDELEMAAIRTQFAIS